jgi:hypothetical protein
LRGAGTDRNTLVQKANNESIIDPHKTPYKTPSKRPQTAGFLFRCCSKPVHRLIRVRHGTCLHSISIHEMDPPLCEAAVISHNEVSASDHHGTARRRAQ